MRLQVFATLGVACLMALPGAVQAQVGRFMGEGTLFGFTQPCQVAGWGTGPISYPIRFHPSGLGGNGDRSAINFLAGFHAMSYMRVGTPFSGSFQSVTMTNIFAFPNGIDQEDELAPQLRIRSMIPAVLTATTSGPVRIRGEIRHFGGIRNCRATFRVIVRQNL